MDYEAIVGEETLNLSLDFESETARVGDQSYPYSFRKDDNGRFILRLGTKVFTIDEVRYNKKKVEFLINGDWTSVAVRDEQDLLLDRLGFKSADEIGEGTLNAPMPGKILDLMVSEGDEVELGQPVAILEAMKMENELKAPIDGVVTSIHTEVGQNLEKNEPIMEIEAGG